MRFLPPRSMVVACLGAGAMLLALPGSPGAKPDGDVAEEQVQQEAPPQQDSEQDEEEQEDGESGEEGGRPGADRGGRSNRSRRRNELVPDRYIVVYEPSVGDPRRKTDELEDEQDVKARHRYTRALEGFSAKLSEEQVDELEADPDVEAVVPDRIVEATATTPLASGDSAPTGVRRLGAATATTTRQASTVGVAVLDTGIDLDHPDLNVAGDGVNCIGGGAPDDDDGHGTHVAGTIGARNNGSGVVGVAPGTRLYPVKVLDANGEGTWSQIICGIDWVTANRSAKNIRVANMSLGGGGNPVQSCGSTFDPLHRAVCTSVQAGVTYVVAAGNEDWDFDYQFEPDVPAAFPEVLTVTAMSDSDGDGGGAGGSPTCAGGEGDDRHASFSNFALTGGGGSHAIAGPGVCIRSTVRGGGYATYSGTSMATPHVAGAVALCLGENGENGPCAGLTPAQIIARMRSDAQARRQAVPAFGFVGDPLSPVGSPTEYFGHLAFAAPSAGSPGGTQTVNATPSAVKIETGTLTGGNAASLAADDNSYLNVRSSSSIPRTTSWYGSVIGIPNTVTAITVTHRARSSVACFQVLSIFNFTTFTWTPLDGRVLGTGEMQIASTAPGNPADYVTGTSGLGGMAVQARCIGGPITPSFTYSGELMRFTHTSPG